MQNQLAAIHLAQLADASSSSKLNLDEALSAVRDVSHALFNLGEFKKAEDIARSIVAKLESLLGNEHVNTLQERGNLACCLQAQGKYEQAEAIQTPLFAKMTSVLGAEHPQTVAVQCNIAQRVLLKHLNVLDKQTLSDATTAIRKVHGHEHPIALKWSGLLAVASDCDASSCSALRVIVVDMKRVFGPNHQDTLYAQMNLTMSEFRCTLATDDFHGTQHTTRLMRVLSVTCTHLFGEMSLISLHAMHGLGQMLFESGQYTDAYDVTRRALSLFIDSMGAEHPHSQNCQLLFARILRKTTR
jgi:tetratricopeptide (TPR) repeat protein